MYNESKYIQALSEISNEDFDAKKWLINNFELYKQTLNWPENLPPINRTNLIKGTLREKFNSTYKELLSGFEYRLNNEKQTLEFKSKNLCWRELLARVFPIHFFMKLSGIKK